MIHQTSVRACVRRRRAALAAAAAAPVALALPALAAAVPAIAADAVCVRPVQDPSGRLTAPALTVTGTGFGPGARVEVRRGARTSATVADAAGTIAAPLSVLDLLTATSAPRATPFTVAANDLGGFGGSPPPQGVSNEIRLKAAPLAFSATPRRARPSARVLFRLSGLTPDALVYAHYRHRGRARADVRLGRASNPCGMLSARRRQIPVRNPGTGLWTVQFDHDRRFSPRATPRIRATVRVYRTFTRR